MGDQVPKEDELVAAEELDEREQGTTAPVERVAQDEYKGDVAVEQLVRVGEAAAGYVDRVTESKHATEADEEEEQDAEAAAAAEQEQPQGPEWVILSAVPWVEPTSQFHVGDHVACVLNDVPEVSLLRISHWISYESRSLDCHPHVLAVDPSGVVFLFSGNDTGPAEPVDEGRPDLYYTAYERTRFHHPSYFLCYPNSGVAAIISDCPEEVHRRDFGLISLPGSPHLHVVAALHQRSQQIGATLWTHSTDDGVWKQRPVRFPIPCDVNVLNWVTDRVISHNGSLWWVSLTQRLVTCNLFDPESRFLKHVRLPVPQGYRALQSGSIEKLSCVSESSGMIRYVLLYCRFGIPTVEMWSLTDSVAGVWRSEYSVPMSDIWSALSYQNQGLKKMLPVIALVHPLNPVVLFLLHESRMFSIDMLDLKVLQSQNVDVEFPIATDICSRFFHAWRQQIVPVDAIQQPRPPNWVMLAALPRVEPRNQFWKRQDAACTFEIPPVVTIPVISRRVCIMPPTIDCPVIICTTPAGVLLLLGSHRLPKGKAEIKGSEIIVTMDTEPRQWFHLCNIYKEDSVLLPSTKHTIDINLVGILTHRLDSSRLIVAELLLPQVLSSEPPAVFCIDTGCRQWLTKTLDYSHAHKTRWSWNYNSMVVYDGELWWFVPNHGLFHCNPFLTKPHLKHTVIPIVLTASFADYAIEKEQCVRVSAGKLRYLVVHGPHESPVVTMYTLEIDEDGDEDWKELYELEFSLSIFINDSYIAHNLLKMKPVIALIDPIYPHIVYFCQDKRIFSIDFDLGVVLSCQPLEILDCGGNWDSHVIEGRYADVQWSKYFHAWELPSTHCLMAHGLKNLWTE
ncbi:hypothetical protein D1007_33478 [Hordeum vulgare]|nr:hypothetical protein D1007_33478 [Hordeum vulgare]